MREMIQKAILDEDGAVSIDWVVITAAVVGISVATGAVVRPTISKHAQSIGPIADQVSNSTSFGQ
ncbi:MAG: hypothetical protein P8L68_18525 [Paracoccaceae bacterium]|nr:hypothetical protein [Paracoccaceae bacterium]MDG2260472.1 hypothetical protein [Paracoccaceae bacterium]